MGNAAGAPHRSLHDLEHRGLARSLPGAPPGARATSASMPPATSWCGPTRTRTREIDLFEVVRGSEGARPDHARGGALLRHPRASPEAPARRLRAGHRRERLPEPLRRGVPDQGEPAAPGGRRGVSLRQAVRLRPGGRLQARAAGRDGDDRGLAGPPHRLQRLQGRQLHRSGDPRHQARPHHHPGGREFRRAGADPASTRRPTACDRASACA